MTDVAGAKRRAAALLGLVAGDVIAVDDVERVARDVLDLADLVEEQDAVLTGQRAKPRFWLAVMRRRLRTEG